jgi:protein ImuB
VDAPVRAMSVRAVALERFADEQPSLFDAGSEAALAQLLDSLTSRLGKDAVTTAHFVADPQPELACRFDPAIARLAPADKRQELDAPLIGQRPLRLFTRPILIEVLFPPSPLRGRGAGGEGAVPLQRFHCAGVEYVIAHCQGPERIETGWWRGDDVQRDYYLVETTEGTRWWIFHRLDDGRWFLHGSFD